LEKFSNICNELILLDCSLRDSCC